MFHSKGIFGLCSCAFTDKGRRPAAAGYRCGQRAPVRAEAIIIGKDGTYLDFYRDVPKENEMNESGRTFFTPKNIFPDLETVKSEILPHCEPIS